MPGTLSAFETDPSRSVKIDKASVFETVNIQAVENVTARSFTGWNTGLLNVSGV